MKHLITFLIPLRYISVRETKPHPERQYHSARPTLDLSKLESGGIQSVWKRVDRQYANIENQRDDPEFKLKFKMKC
jgi:hypothetical protein